MSRNASPHASVARSAGVIGILTLGSRLLGFVRDILIAQAFGTRIEAEAFVVSFKLPNLFRDLVGEGAASAAIVPVLSETRKRGEKPFWELVGTLFCWFVGVLSVLTVAGVVFAPWVVGMVAPGFLQDPSKHALTVQMTRIIFPFIFLVGLSAFLMGVLHSIRNFGTSAAGPMILNLVMILALFWAVPKWGPPALGIGILVGGVLQCLLQIVSVIRAGAKLTWSGWINPGVLKILKLLAPRVWGSAVYQTSVFIDTILASFYWIVGEGGQSALYYASRIFQLPLAIFGVSLAQASLPTLSSHAADNQKELFAHSLLFAIRNVIYTSVPAALGLACFSQPIIEVLFKRGAFDAASVRMTSGALFYYSLGLVACGLVKVLVNACYALQDTRTPVKTATLCLGVNFGLNLILMRPLQVGGLALSTTLAASLNCWLLWRSLEKRIKFTALGELRPTLLQSGGAGLLMGIADLWIFNPWIRSACAAGGRGTKELLASILLSVVIYFGLTWIFGSEEARSAGRFFKQHRKE